MVFWLNFKSKKNINTREICRVIMEDLLARLQDCEEKIQHLLVRL
jgi:hypothetical protein